MSPRVILAVGVAFFLLGVGALGGALALRPAPPASVPQPTAATVSPAPPPPSAAPAAPPAPAPPAPPAPTPAVAAPQPAAQPAPAPASPTPPPPSASPEAMRPKLGMSVSDANLLNGPVDIGPNGIGIAERAPKVSGISAGPASEGGVHVGDRVFAVDGRSISSAAEFEAVLQGKTAPGEVVLRVGQTRGDAHDVKIVFK